jgi:hypothetical protein
MINNICKRCREEGRKTGRMEGVIGERGGREERGVEKPI